MTHNEKDESGRGEGDYLFININGKEVTNPIIRSLVGCALICLSVVVMVVPLLLVVFCLFVVIYVVVIIIMALPLVLVVLGGIILLFLSLSVLLHPVLRLLGRRGFMNTDYDKETNQRKIFWRLSADAFKKRKD